MKTLKIFIVMCIISGFTSNSANSQPERTESSIRVVFFVPCVNENITGYLIAERVAWTNQKEDSPHPYSKIQLKYGNAVLYGQKSHLAYTLDFISNGEWSGQSADINHFVRMVMIRLDGKLIALLPILVQRTITPDGEEVVNINDFGVRCF
ncbi:MAG: hypothetical protein LLG13_15045 [Bacteroidales bacterium]|nr:hypothetical protein [Bacteroidales bacterium]